MAFSTMTSPASVAEESPEPAVAAMEADPAEPSLAPNHFCSRASRVPSARASASASSSAAVSLGLSLLTTMPYCSPVGTCSATLSWE